MKRMLAVLVAVTVVMSAGIVLADATLLQIPFTTATSLEPGTYTFRFSLWELESGGYEGTYRVWWEEKSMALTDPAITTFLGSVSDPASRSGFLGDVNFRMQYWVQVEKREADGTYTVLGPRTMFTMAPYAMWAAQGGSVTSVTAGNGLMSTGPKGDITISVNPGAGLAATSNGISIASGGVVNSMIANSAVTKSKVGGLAYGGIPFGTSLGNMEQDASNLFWDDVNNRLGLGTTVPQDQLELTGNLRLPWTTATSGQIRFGGAPFIHTYGGTGSVFAGYNAGNFSMTGANNAAVGAYALMNNTSGYSNAAMGYSALQSNSSGYGNTAQGSLSLKNNTTGFANAAAGYYALWSNSTGHGNAALGSASLESNTTGNLNAALGYNALFGNIDGNNNSAIGDNALMSNTSGDENAASGSSALYRNTTGNDNTASGSHALVNNTTGGNNAALGYLAGDSNASGSNNTFLGSGADATYNNLTNATAVGSNALVGRSNSLVLGSDGVNVGIGTSTPTVALDVSRDTWLLGRFKNDATTGDRTAMLRFETGDTTPVMWNLGAGGSGNGIGQTSGQFYLESSTAGVAMSVEKNKNIHFYPSGGGSCNLSSGASGWSCSSDRNLKENFTEIDRQELLDHLSAMPITTWNMKGTTVKHIGPVAQDFYAAFSVGEDDTHINTVDANGVSMAAIQALYDIVKKQHGMIEKQQEEIDGLQAQIGAGCAANGR